MTQPVTQQPGPVPHPFVRGNGSQAWRVRFRLTPGGNPVSETFEDAEQAYRFAALVGQIGGAAARRVRDAAGQAHQFRTVRTALAHHLESLEASATPGTIEGYERLAAKTFLARLGPIPVDALTEDDVIAWVAWQRKQETIRGEIYAPKTIRNAHSILSATLNRELRAGRVARNVAAGITLPSNMMRTREPVFLTPNQFTTLHGCVKPRAQLFVAFLYGTGTRFGEATALTAGDFDLDAAVPTVRVTRAWKKAPGGGVELGSPKTRMARRTISLPASLVPALREHLADVAPTRLAFTAPRGGAILSSPFHQQIWARAVAAANLGVKPRVHDLRHSHASWLISQNVPLPVIQRRLGHENITTTVDTYGHLAPDALLLAATAADLAIVQTFPELEA